jgi:hypothetical protein
VRLAEAREPDQQNAIMVSVSAAPLAGNTRKRRKIDQGLATVIAAMIGLAAAWLGGRATAPAATASSDGAGGRARISIIPPASGNISHHESYSGNVDDLHRGQLVWIFNQTVGVNGPSDRVYPGSGPCPVNYDQHTWSCREIYIGLPRDTRTFMICAAIISEAEAAQIVGKLSGHDAWLTLVDTPYIADSAPACMSVHRT